jgi:hypothetical protein
MKHEQLRVILQKTREYIEQGWTQNAMARMGNSQGVDPVDPRATCWCLVGALRRATHFSPTMTLTAHAYARSYRAFSATHDYLAQFIPLDDIDDMILFNDAEETTQEDVIAVLDKALKRL